MNSIQHHAPENSHADILRGKMALTLQLQFHLDKGLKTHMHMRAQQVLQWVMAPDPCP